MYTLQTEYEQLEKSRENGKQQTEEKRVNSNMYN